jgi:AraC-like DNA-binding protein
MRAKRRERTSRMRPAQMTIRPEPPLQPAPGRGLPRALPTEAARDGFMRQNMALDVVNHSTEGKAFSIVVRNFGAVRVANIDPPPASFVRARNHLADGRDIVSMVVSRGGRFSVEGVQGEASCSPHGAAVLESRRESVLHSPDGTSVWTICMDRAALQPLLGAAKGPVQQCLQGDCAPLRLLSGYLHTLFSLDDAGDPALVSQQIRDLALCAFGVSGDARELVHERSVREVRLRTVLDQIKVLSADPALDPQRFAARLQLSVRYLRRLLEPTGRTFVQHLLGYRLEQAAAMLRDPALDRLRIGDVAARTGFSDISHFNRGFRRTFGLTPREMRAGRLVIPAHARSA